MSVPTGIAANRVRRGPVRASLLALTVVLAACSGSAASPTGPTNAGSASPAPSGEAASAPAGSPVPSTAASVAPTAASFVAPGLAPLTLRWKGSGPVGAKTSTFAIATDPESGDLWVSIPFENRFWIFSPAGKYLESWGTGGKGDGQFDLNDHAQNPDGFGAIAFASDGSFYVGDVGNTRVQKFDKDRKFVKSWGTFGSDDGQFSQITAIATDGKTVTVGDGGRGDIQAFDNNGTFLRKFGAGFGAFLTLDTSGNVYATNPSVGAQAVAKFDATGKETARFDMAWAGGDAVGLAIEANGNIVVGVGAFDPPYDGLGTYELDPTGRPILGWKVGGGESLAISPSGDTLYATRGIGLVAGVWTDIKAYALPKR